MGEKRKKEEKLVDNLYYTIVSHIPFALMIFISLPVHEFAHGLIANKLGDDTAYYQGRLTLNPFAHLDLFGTISMVLFGYGWAKPVPVNPTRFNCNMRLGMALTALAGPLSNLILSLIFLILGKGVVLIGNATGNEFFYFANWILMTISYTNILLAFFNLIPIPPLDGSRILNYFLPYRAQAFMDNLERHSFIILMIFLIIDNRTSIFSGILGFLCDKIFWAFDKITFFLGEGIFYPLSYFLF